MSEATFLPNPARVRLPHRRMTETVAVPWGGIVWHVGVSVLAMVDDRGRDVGVAALEVFASGGKVGSDVEALIDDACVLASLALQAGYSAAELHARLGREGIDANAAHASLLGAIVAAAAQLESEAAQRLQEG